MASGVKKSRGFIPDPEKDFGVGTHEGPQPHGLAVFQGRGSLFPAPTGKHYFPAAGDARPSGGQCVVPSGRGIRNVRNNIENDIQLPIATTNST